MRLADEATGAILLHLLTAAYGPSLQRRLPPTEWPSRRPVISPYEMMCNTKELPQQQITDYY